MSVLSLLSLSLSLPALSLLSLLSLPTPLSLFLLSLSPFSSLSAYSFSSFSPLSLSLSALTDSEILGVGSLLKKYIALLCTHIGDILPVATSIAFSSHRHFAEVSHVIEGDLTGNSFQT